MQSPRRTQRLGAYAVVVRPDDTGRRHLLLTRISPVGYPAGWWALPGGGVDHGESPNDTVVRELYEETGLRATSTRLVEVHDVHVVESGRGDAWEDFHGVHLVYAADVEGVGLPAPHVVDVGGTTDIVRWVPLDALLARRPDADEDGVGSLLPVVEHVLEGISRYEAFLAGGV